MPRKAQPDFFVAQSSGIVKVNGQMETYLKGQTIVHRDSDLYKLIPERFKPVERPPTEKATAAPGEFR
jgi:hypothetical protein